MRNRIWKSVVSVVLVLAILLTSNSLLLTAFAAELPHGVGIYNHVMTSENAANTRYFIKFYKIKLPTYNFELIPFTNELEIGSDMLTPYTTEDENGDPIQVASVFLGKDEQLTLDTNEGFQTFIRDNMISKIEISYEYELVDRKETAVLYSEQVQTYDFWEEKTNAFGIKTKQSLLDFIPGHDPFGPVKTDEKFYIKQFDSTLMQEVTVEQSWRDRGVNRPEITAVQFDLKGASGGTKTLFFDHATAVYNATMDYYTYTLDNPAVTNEDFKTYLEIESFASNTWRYHYTVPEFAPNGNTIVYTSEQFFPDAFADAYRLEDHVGGDPNRYLAVGLTDFTFTMSFLDNYDHTARPVIDENFIRANFTLYRKVNNQEQEVDFLSALPNPTVDPDAYAEALAKRFEMSVNDTTGVVTVTIKGLEDIKEDGTANEYYLKQDDPNHRMPINQSAEHADPDHDYYDVKSENSGLHASELYTTYDGGEINFLLSGETDFSANVFWKDIDTADTRRADTYAAELALWRYVGADADDAALVVTQEINGANDNPTVSFQRNSKYDIAGDIYKYYAVEHVSVEAGDGSGDKLPYVAEYPTIDRKLLNGETVVNKLSDMVEYSISADWIAAARQGGIASATYRLQRKAQGGDWTYLDGMELTVNYNEHYMSRHNDASCIFPEVNVYDEDGARYEYRVVQTGVTRTDVMKDGNTPITDGDNTLIGDSITKENLTENEIIQANDFYAVTLVREDENGNPSADGTDFHFTYLIQGDTYVHITKVWKDENGNLIDTTGGNYSCSFDVQNFNNNVHDYRNYFKESDYPAGYFDTYLDPDDGYFTREIVDGESRIVFRKERVVLNNQNHFETIDIPVPRYDYEGREIPYRAVEVNKTFPNPVMINGDSKRVGYHSDYQWNVEYDIDEKPAVTRYNMNVTNIRTFDGGDRGELSISKEWVDDGELEFRRPIRIIANSNVYASYGTQSKVLNRENVWEERIGVTVKYKRDPNTGERIIQDGHYVLDEGSYIYNPADFIEAPENGADGATYYWSLADIDAIKQRIHVQDPDSGNLSDEEEWIYRLLSTSEWGGAVDRNKLNTDNSIDLKESNDVGFTGFAGIYKSAPTKKLAGTNEDDPYSCHYYAVKQQYTPGGVNNVVGTLRFTNIRIGVVSYEVLFDWNVGEALANGTIQSVTMGISGEGLKEDGTSHINQIETTIDPHKLIKVQKGGKTYYAYYVLNLPKYDGNGKLIDYKLNEIAINGSRLNADDVILVGDDRCEVHISSETITNGEEARSDDLHTIIITNRYKDNETISVNKLWVDNANKENTRSDLYIKLYRLSDNPKNKSAHTQYPIEQLYGSIDGEYIWEQDAQDSDIFWTYHFDDLPKYDEDGYPYTYFVREQDPSRLPGYIQEYAPNVTSTDETTHQTTRNPKVYLTDAQLAAAITAKQNGETFGQYRDFDGDFSNVAFNGGTITNRLYGEVVINGIKLWQNISPLLNKLDYPIADVTLYRDFHDMNPQDYEKLRHEINLSEQEYNEKKVLIAETTIRNGENSFHFPQPSPGVADRGFVIMENATTPKTENGSIVLPKYDELGIRLAYKLEEVPINGYVSKIEPGSQKMINEYHGGAKLHFDVNKHWDGMEDKQVFPTITMTLYQVFLLNDGTYQIMNRFEREIRATGDTDVSVSFPDAEHPDEANSLRYYAPTGVPYVYFVTETLSNYEGDRVLFIDGDKLDMIRTSVEDKYDRIIVFDENRSGQALGFTSTVSDPLDAPEDVVRAMLASQYGVTAASAPNPELDAAVTAYLAEKDNGPVPVAETITNAYRPDAEYFHGKIDVTKEWETQKLDEQDKLEFDHVRSYNFALSRFTGKINSEILFSVTTPDDLPTEPHITPNSASGFSITDVIPAGENTPEIRAHDFLPSMSADAVVAPGAGQEPQYYIGVVIKGNHAVTVVIDVSTNGSTDYHNTVHITGLAVYGYDAVKYSYTITESPKPGYTTSVKSGDTKQLSSNAADPAPEVELKNTLDVFDLKIHKSFAKEYDKGDGTSIIEPIRYKDYEQFFNNAYFDQLVFTLYRCDTPGQPEPYRTVTGAQIRAAVTSGDAELDSSGTGGYAYTFTKLPIMNETGAPYTYWVTETDGAQTGSDPKVYTRYADESFTIDGTTGTLGNGKTPPCNVSAEDKDSTKDAYAQNIFKAKKISIRKYWLDGNNEDGLRPDQITTHIYERYEGISEDISFTLTLPSETDAGGWTLDAALARYYFNGTSPENLFYKINEKTDDDFTGYTLVEYAGTYGGEGTADPDNPNSYTVPGTIDGVDVPLSDSLTYKPIGVENPQDPNAPSFDVLNLTNYKMPVKSSITLTKSFDQYDSTCKADTRPDYLYFKLLDETGSSVDYTALKAKVKVGGSETYEEGGVTKSYLDTATGVIKVPRGSAPGYDYPDVTVTNLPLGYSTGADLQHNGTYTVKHYRFVECDASGGEVPETFPYTWSGGDPVAPWDYFSTDFQMPYGITNSLKKENHTVKKQWNDDANNGVPNYYNTRPNNIYVSLQRTTDATPSENGTWEAVYENDIALTTNKTSLNAYDNYSSNAAFNNLPQYDKDGNRYHYRVVETYIGSNAEQYNGKFKTDKTYNDGTQTYPASNVYYVDYDDSLTDTQTTIDNHLIRKTDYQNVKVDKIWVDNSNQDGKREPVTVVLKQYTEERDGDHVIEHIEQELEEELNEANNWHYEWTNYPKADADGNQYHYDVYEKGTTDGYTATTSELIHSDVSSGANSYEKREVTNTHTQAISSLTVDKQWLNESAGDKDLRPESIEFVLCCQYTAYKYVSEDPDTHAQTDLTTDEAILAAMTAGTLKLVEDTAKSYDGPVNYGSNTAQQLLTYYPNTAKNNSYDPNDQSSQAYNYSITLRPNDKKDDDQWKNAVTFDNLPVYINTCGSERWNGKESAVTYYVTEVQPTYATGENPYKYGVSYENAQHVTVRPHGTDGEGTSTDTTLLNGETPEAKTVTASNELKTRNITVTKVWVDNGYGDSLHYDIDFTLTSTNNPSQFEYQETRTLSKNATDSNQQPVLTVTFTDLPVYDKDGAVLQYTVAETVHGGSGATADHQSGYVQSQPVAAVDSHGILTGYTITNTLPVIRFKADKVWNDNHNQDGSRPGQLNFTLQRTAESTTDNVVTKNDTSAAHENDSTAWNVDFNVQPEYNVNNTAYTYGVTEEAANGGTLSARGYTRYVYVDGVGTTADKNNYVITTADIDLNVVTTAAESGVTVKTFHFMNRYTPQEDSLKITKSWQDTADGKDFSGWTRPASVTVALKCTYNGQTVDLTTADSTNPVKALFPSGYQFTRDVTAGNTWQETFGDLPLKVNPTGTAVFNGQEYTITYFVEEVPLNGYTTAYSPETATLNTAAEDGITVTNTLKTKQFWVKKVWDDQGYSGSAASHYDVNVQLTNTNSGVTYSEGKTIATSDSAAMVVYTVPQYIANGDKATYSVTELASDRQYGYVTTYSADHEFNAVDLTTNTAQNPIIITNTLPLTEITVNKQWEDNSDQYTLRPDSISIKLQRRPVTNNGTPWASDNEGWTDYDATVTGTGNSWSYTYSKLPKFDANNIEYAYRVTESTVNAYDTTYRTAIGDYTAGAVTKSDSHDNSDSTISFGVKNTLITENITLHKVWDDNGYADGDSLHYPVTFTVKKPSALTGFTFNDMDVTVQGTTWNQTCTVPVYDAGGNPIQYTVTEEKTAPHYGYTQTGETAFTQTGTHTGNSNYYDSYTITNTLPLTDVTAVKHWAGDVELYPNSAATVKVNLTRSSNNTQDTAFNNNAANEKTIVYTNGQSDSVSYEKLLAYDVDNNPYTYKVTEQTVTGYSTSYDKQEIAATEQDASNRVVTITNTPLKSSADFVKYDETDKNKHGADSRFTVKTLQNAQFELYRERENQADKQFYATLANGVYTIADQNAAGATGTFTSGSDGVIRIDNLEPNRYYLKETGAPTGYQTTNTKFYFTVSVDEQTNQISVSYDNQLTDLTAFQSGSNLSSVHGLPNDQNMSKLTLTKVDERQQTIKLPNATYHLLRLYDYTYRKSGAQGANAQEYLTNALATLTADGTGMDTYWEKVGQDAYVTDADGKITVEGHMFGTYVFYEVKAPTGYKRDFTTGDGANVIGPVELNTANAAHETEVHNLTHLEPRTKAHINVLKTDENGNPLRSAVFKLYKDGDPNTLLATFTTGYNGMNATAFELDCSQYDWNQKFYLIEETPPTGYSADNVPEKNKIEFTLTPELAEEALHIVRANDARLKGKVTLTKTASAQTTTNNAGDPLSGAVFELYTKAGEGPLQLYPHSTETNKWRVYRADDDTSVITQAGFDVTAAKVTEVTTAADGKLHIEGIDWGDYYLKEKTVPTGFQLPGTEDARKVFFSVGQNNSGDTPQELSMKNDPLTATLNIIKEVNQLNIAAWGEPTFIFTVKQTERYDAATDTFVALTADKQRTLTKTVKPLTAIVGGYRDETGAFDVEPGKYSITEIRVARYTAAGASVTATAENVTAVSNDLYTAELTVKPNGAAEVTFFNTLTNYEKLSHTDKVNNRFNGYKAISVEDKDLTLDASAGTDQCTVTVPKSALSPKLLRADGTAETITDLNKLVVSYAGGGDVTITDEGASIKVSGHRADISGSVYKLTAVYDGKFTDGFELRFTANPLFTKTEKTVTFLNDAQNRSHYTDNGETNVYTLHFILEVVPDGNSTTEVVRRILHNGTPTGKTDQTAFPALTIEPDYSGRYEFDQWAWSYAGTSGTVTGTGNSAALLAAIRGAPDNAAVTVTAVLKEKSP